MTPEERVRAAIQGKPVDRAPFIFWHHFKPEGSGEKLAELSIDFFVKTFRLDIVKIMPDLPYPRPEQPFTEAEQMRFLPKLDLATPAFAQQLECIHAIRRQIGDDYPLILTLFSPLTYALQFLGKENAVQQARKDPAPFEEGLGTLSANLRQLMEAAIDAGASGIFFSCMGATTKDFTQEEYQRFSRPYDLHALSGAQNGWLNIVHIHADPNQIDDEVHFELFTDYPVSVMSWSDRLTGPSLTEALTLTDKCLMGGLAEHGPLTHGGQGEIENEILAAVTQTKGQRLILANGCSIPDDTPPEWLHTARRLVDDLF